MENGLGREGTIIVVTQSSRRRETMRTLPATPQGGSVPDISSTNAASAATSGIAVLVPCYNEELTIEKVVTDFRRELPHAQIYVYDNNSTDHTAEVAARAGALVRREARQGKGNVVRRMFADIDAQVYVMVDGDDTYEAAAVRRLVAELINNQLDMVTGARETAWGTLSPRPSIW